MPCLNGGVCSTTGPDQYLCECAEEFEGENCELTRTDECVPDPCQNGATCVVSCELRNGLTLLVHVSVCVCACAYVCVGGDMR